MNTTQRKLMWIALMALLALFAACKGESPTSPTTTPPTTGTTGTTTPPTGASVNISASATSLQINSQSIITVSVTQNGAAVPNGTAVQFDTTLGSFTDTGSAGTEVIKTTTAGVATATLTSGSPGAATVTATVNNVSKQIVITFSSGPITPTPPSTAPTITSITPTTGRPEGGETITINGTNFRAPVRVVFTCEGSAATPPDATVCNGVSPKDALIVSVTPTQIKALTPQFNVATGQAVTYGITVFVGAGTSTETSVSQPSSFTFSSPVLNPAINGVTPTSGPIGGGTRVTIMGSGFQSPVQVFFGSAEAQVVSVNFSQIIVMSPRASDTNPSGSGTVIGPIQIRVRNINSATETTADSAFRYVAKMQITTAGPLQGPIVGGTKVTIDGAGFDDPLGVTVGGAAAQVIRVSGSEVVVVTQQPLLTACANLPGPIIVTNTENGDTATGPIFTFIVPLPKVISASGPTTPGGTTNVIVLNAQGVPRIAIGGKNATITGTTVNSDGTTTFTVIVPPNVTLDTLSCNGISGVSAQTTTQLDVQYTSLTTGCTDTFAGGLTVNPANPILTMAPPTGFTPFTATAAVGGATPSPAVPAPDQTVILTNTGAGTITVNSVTLAGAGCGNFNVTFPPPPQALQACDIFGITVHYNTGAAGSSSQCTATIVTTAGTKTLALSGSTQ